MNYGLYLSASGALANLYRQDVFANNLANSNTVGFKPDIAITRQRRPERLENPGSLSAMADPQYLLEKLGGGLFGHPNRISMKQGDLLTTDAPLDVAIRGDGFLVVGEAGDADENLFLTRDGRLTLNQDSQLVMASSGRAVLDVDNQSITLDPTAKISINGSGEIIQNENIVATLRLASPSDPTELIKVGHSLMALREGSGATLVPGSGNILQGSVETSATNPIMTLNNMISATKAVQANATMMQYLDQILGQSVNTLGRVT